MMSIAGWKFAQAELAEASSDTILGSTATTSSVSVTGSASSAVNTAGDQDWWKVTLSAGTTYTFKLNAGTGSTLDAYLRLLNSSGTQVGVNNDAATGNKNAQITFKATTSGTYYLSAQGNGTSTGAYVIASTPTDTVLGTKATTASVAVNGSASSTVDFAGDQDWWKVTLSAGTTYTLKLNAGTGSTLDAYLRLLNGSGTQVGANNDAATGNKNAQITFKATTSGTYYLSAQGSGTSTGAYALSVVATDTVLGTTATTSSVAVNGSASSTVDFAGDQDWWKVTLSAGTTYTFKLNAGTGSTLDAYLRLLNGSGTLLSLNDNAASGTKNAQITFKATTSGTYYLSAQGGSGTTGAYALSVVATDTVLGTTATTSSVAVNGSASSTVDFAGDQDWWKVTLSAGTTYTFKLNAGTGSTLDAYLRLLNGSGTLLSLNDNAASGTKNAQITFKATTSGTYYLSAQGGSGTTGAYALSVVATDTVLGTKATTANVAVNGSASSTVDFAGDQDWWKVTLSAGTTYTFKLNAGTGSTLDAYLRLLNGSGTQVGANNDAATGNKNAQITFTATTSGTYYLSAQGNGTSTGAYALSVVATDTVLGTTATTSSVAVNGSASSTVDFSSDQDWWKVTLSAGTTYTFKLNAGTGSTLDAYLRLLNGSGTQVGANNDAATGNKNAQITFTATTSGTYYLSAQGNGTSTGAYALSVVATDTVLGTTATTSSVAVNGSASSTVDFSSDQDWWKVTLSAGTTYTFKLNAGTGSTLDAYLRLLNGSGTQVGANNDAATGNKNAQITFTATTSGTYYLSAQGNGTSTGAYALSVVATDTVLGTTATTSSVAVNGSASSTVDFAGDQDWWKVTLSKGTTYTFKLNAGTGSALDAYLRVLSSSGVQMGANNDAATGNKNAQFTFTATSSGTYYVSAQGSNSTTGAYALSVVATDTVLGTTATTSSVAVNGSASSTVDFAGDQDWWKVTLSKGTTYTFKLNAGTGSALDAYLRVLSSSGVQMGANNDAATGNKNAQFTFTATSSGTYYVSAQGSNSTTGAYALSVVATDTVLGTTATTSSVAVNGSASSTVDFAGDQDWWKVTLSAGTTYVFNLRADSGSILDAYLGLLDGSASLLSTNDNAASGTSSAQITFTATANGTYYLAAQGSGSTTGAYVLEVLATDTILGSTATTASVGINDTASSTVDYAGEQDWWKVTLSAGTTYTFDLKARSGSLLDAYLRLLDSNGVQLKVNDAASDGTLDAQITFTATSNGTYHLSAQGAGGTSGAYTLSVQALDVVKGSTATTDSVTLNATAVESTVDFAGDQDWWKVTLTAGTTYTFQLGAGTGSALDAYLRVLSSTGSSLSVNNNASSSTTDAEITFTAGSSGTYYLSAQGSGGTTGAYTLFATTDTIVASASTASIQTVNASASASAIDFSGDHDWWKVSLVAGTTYVFELKASTGSSLDAFLRLIDDSGSQVGARDGGFSAGTDAKITYTATTSGTYYLSAQGTDGTTGDYTVFATTDLIAGSTETTSTVGLDGTASTDVIDYAGDQDWWTVTLTAGTAYVFYLSASTDSSLDAYLRLLDGNGAVLETNNNQSSDTTDARVVYEVTQSGTYYLSAQGVSGSLGAYDVFTIVDDVVATTATTSELSTSPGAASSGTIDYGTDQDWWQVTLVAGRTYTFRLGADVDSSLDAYLRLIDQDGTQVAAGNDSTNGSVASKDARVTYTATYSGTYYVSAQGYDGSEGDYVMSVGSDAIDGSVNTTASLTVNGEAGSSDIDESADQDWWRIRLTAGSSYTFRLTAPSGSSLDPYLRLLSSTGVELEVNDDSGSSTQDSVISFTATTTGVYYLSAQGSGTTFGSYNIQVFGDAIAGSTDTTTVLTINTTGTSTIDTVGDQDWWQVTLTAGTAYEFQLQAADGSSIDAYLRLLDSSGDLVTFNDDNGSLRDSLLIYTPTTSGTYYLSAQSRDVTGDYVISAMASDAIPGTIESTVTLDVNGVAGASVIDLATDQDWWKITLTAGATYTFLMKPQTGSTLDPYLRLMDSEGQELTSNNDRNGSTVNAYITYTATTSGTYFLAAQSNSGASGDALAGLYTIKANSVDIIDGANTTTSVLVVSGAEGSSMIDSSTDQDWWKVELTAGTAYTFRLSAAADSPLDAYLRLLSSDGTALVSNDDSGSSKNSVISYTAKTTGVFYLSAQGYGASTGAYVISVTSAASDSIPGTRATKAVLTVDGDAGSSTVDATADQDWWKITLVSGTTYTFDLKAAEDSSLDSYLRLLDSSGVLVTYNDDNDGADDAQIIYTATKNGTFYLSAQGYGSSTGAYLLTAVSDATDTIPGSASTTSTLTVNGEAGSSAIDSNGDQDWWKVRLKVGVTYVFTLSADTDSTLDTTLRLLNSAGTKLTSNDDINDSNKNSRITYTASATGTYYLSAQGYNSTGAYTIAVVSSSAASLAEAASDASATDAEVFSFTATRSEVATISDFDTGTDRIEVTSSNFGGLKVGALSAANFQSAGSTLTSRAAVFLYDNTTGSLAFDADGAGAGAAVQIAQLTGARTLRASDIFVVNG